MGVFYDARCTACGAKIGWFGTMRTMPACPKCGQRPAQADLDAADEKLNREFERIERREKERWDRRTPAQDAWASEGAAAFAAGQPEPIGSRNPYWKANGQGIRERCTDAYGWYVDGWRRAERAKREAAAGRANDK